MLEKTKINLLVVKLANRGVFSKEENFSFYLMHDLSRLPKEKWEYRLKDQLNFGISYIKRAVSKMLYQPGFSDKIEFDYHYNLLSYARAHSFIDIFRTK